jgi:IS30 family transposase
MFERQKRVKDLLASGMQQKDIASAIGVNAATVSRDVGAIKVQEQEKKPVASKPARGGLEDDEDDEDEGDSSASAAIAAKVKADKEARVKAQAERAEKDAQGEQW